VSRQVKTYPDGLPPPEQHLHLHLPPKPENLTDWEAQVRDARQARQALPVPKETGKEVQDIVPESTNNCTPEDNDSRHESTKSCTSDTLYPPKEEQGTKSCTDTSEVQEAEKAGIEDTNHAREGANPTK